MMKPNELLDEAKTLQPQLQKWRRTIHRNPEVGFDLPKTKALVKQALTEMGYAPQDCGRAGVLALAGGKRPGKTILLRGDMDALPIFEESGEVFASEVPGKMHGCGHDMHTAMMLGAAKLLKEHEEEIEGTVKLEFQPAEEIFQGSPDRSPTACWKTRKWTRRSCSMCWPGCLCLWARCWCCLLYTSPSPRDCS